MFARGESQSAVGERDKSNCFVRRKRKRKRERERERSTKKRHIVLLACHEEYKLSNRADGEHFFGGEGNENGSGAVRYTLGPRPGRPRKTTRKTTQGRKKTRNNKNRMANPEHKQEERVIDAYEARTLGSEECTPGKWDCTEEMLGHNLGRWESMRERPESNLGRWASMW